MSKLINRDSIRRIFMEAGFTVKEGQKDLKDYVYEAAETLLQLAAATQVELVTEDDKVDALVVKLLKGDMSVDDRIIAAGMLAVLANEIRDRDMAEIPEPVTVMESAKTLTAAEQKWIMASPNGLAALIDYHSVQDASAYVGFSHEEHKDMFDVDYHKRKLAEYRAMGRALVAEDPDCYSDQEKAIFK